nr:hypothetical protein 15 [bacterium]
MTQDELDELHRQEWEELLAAMSNDHFLQMAAEVIQELDAARREVRALKPHYGPALEQILKAYRQVVTGYEIDVAAGLSEIPTSRTRQ